MKIKSDQPKTVHISKTRKAKIVQFYKYAAILVVAVLLGSVGYYFGFINHIPAVYTEVVSAEKQVLDEYILPDGSVIALNSSSTLVFPKQFEDDVREVTISGEAFFDVKPNPEKPFLINAGGTQIKVLGTSFNVRAYPETETVEVIVETGKVQVTQKNGDLLDDTRELFLTPGEKGTLFYKSNLLEKSKNTNINFLAWKTNDIIFKETPLNEVIQCLEKVYHIEIDLADPELENEVLTAHFDKKPVDFVLNVIRLTFNLELTGENEHYTLASRTN
jgi:ferric-dicitrate binding protein FerR (iron transport regulator)